MKTRSPTDVFNMADMYNVDESIECESVQVNLPDIEDTQIWENENETREVALYLETKDGKVSGAEYVPFVLPYRWTFSTLQNCIEDYINNRLGYSNRKISQIYFKRCGKSRSVVAVNSDRDIPAMLSEYPMKTQNGRRSKKAVMVLAVDMTANDPLVQTPRRSPRLLARKSLYRSSTQSSENGSPSTQTMDVFLFDVSKSNKGEPKLSKTASVIHSVPTEVTLAALKDIVRGHQVSQSVIYVPANGFYWLRKASKQMVELGTEADLIYCKEEYKGASIRIGCASVDLNTVLTGTGTARRPAKRSLEYLSEKEADTHARDMKVVEAASKPKESKKSSNDLWNDCHCDLVRDLQKKGTIQRYSVRHLKLWTDHMVEGRSAGSCDEPSWEDFIDIVGVPPKQRGDKKALPSPESSGSSDQLLKTMMIQTQKNIEIFQTSLLAILANQRVQSPIYFSPGANMCSTPVAPVGTQSSFFPHQADSGVKESKSLIQYTTTDCVSFLEANNLAQFIPHFFKAEMDGPLLASLCHVNLGESILEGMGINKDEGQMIVQAIKSVMAYRK